MKLTNTTLSTQNFVVGMKDGEPVVESLKPGECRSISVKDDDPTLVAHVFVGGTLIEGKAAATHKAVKANAEPGEQAKPHE